MEFVVVLWNKHTEFLKSPPPPPFFIVSDKGNGKRFQYRFLFLLGLWMVQVKVMSSVCARYKAHTFFFNSVSVLYSVIYREKTNLPASTSVLFYLFFYSLLWIVGILVISKLLLYHFLFIYAAVFVLSFVGLCILLKYFLFHIIFYIYFPLILYLAQSIHPTAPLLSAWLCLAIVTVVVCIWHFQITVYPSF